MANLLLDPSAWTVCNNYGGEAALAYWSKGTQSYDLSGAGGGAALQLPIQDGELVATIVCGDGGGTPDGTSGLLVARFSNMGNFGYPSSVSELQEVYYYGIGTSHDINLSVEYTGSDDYIVIGMYVDNLCGFPQRPADYTSLGIVAMPSVVTSVAYNVYELDKGFTFDGKYIPHYAILNWYFGNDPTVYKTMQKVRIHGMTKGVTYLQVQTNGIQTDYREAFSDPEHLDLTNPDLFVVEDFEPSTNYAELANRGLAIQLKFEGRNRDLDLPEPTHVLQVLVPQSSPEGSGFSSN